MKLGILYKDGKIVNHRSLIKVLLNPIFRKLGFQIGSICINNEIKGIKIDKCKKANEIKWDFNSYNEYDILIKKRIII
jgi:hypothetical protein